VARAERRAQHKNFIGYAAIIAFALLTLAAVAAHGGSILNLAFPLLATALGGALFIYCRNIYIAYTWWIWLFSPEVRRLVDFQTHFHTISPVMLSPLLVTSFALLAVAGRPRFLLHRSMLPFALIALVTLFAFITGVFISGFFGSAYEWGTWLEPLAFCVFLMMDSRAIQENRRALLSAIIIGLVIIGAYGIYQFFHLPPWDAAWLTNSRLRSEGAAYAEQVRVFGTLNDSGAFAFVLTGSLIFMLVARGPLRFVGGAVGFPSFLLAQERQSWGAWLIAAAFVFWRMGGKARLRVGLAATIIAAIATPILTVGPVATKLSARFASIQNVQTDYSGQVRAALYKNFLATALSQPIGNGFGALGIAAKLTVGQTVDFDSGLLELPFTFGWVGCLIFTWSVSRLALTILGRYLKTKDPITIAASGLFFGMLGVLIFAQVFTGAGGMVLWTAVALALTTPETLHNRRLGKI
jgi:hypothetical protein